MTEKERQRFAQQVWREKEREHGFPCPRMLRRLVKAEEYLTGSFGEDTEKQDFRDAVDDCFRRQLPVIFHFAIDFACDLAGEPQDYADEKPPSKRVYQKCFERRLRILGFVAERALPPLGVLSGNFSKSCQEPHRLACGRNGIRLERGFLGGSQPPNHRLPAESCGR